VSQSVIIDDLAFSLRRSDRRKTLGITVDRDGQLILTAPSDCPQDLIERKAHEKLPWVWTKLAEKELLVRPGTAKEFVSGEGFYYLGRSYRLLLVDPSNTRGPALRLHEGRFMLRRDQRHCAQEHFIRWYIQEGGPWLRRRVELLSSRIGVTPRGVDVRDLGFRWGSCGCDGALYLHWRTVCLPPGIIEYVVAHELVHLCEPHHNQAFWERLARAMPDYLERKQWLAENGSDF
jgi:predicted metal-dependent hydrolase